MNQGSGYSSMGLLAFRFVTGYTQDTDWSCTPIKTQLGKGLFPPHSFTWLLVISSFSRIAGARGSATLWLLIGGSPQFFSVWALILKVRSEDRELIYLRPHPRLTQLESNVNKISQWPLCTASQYRNPCFRGALLRYQLKLWYATSDTITAFHNRAWRVDTQMFPYE